MPLHATRRPVVVGTEKTLASELVTSEARHPRPPSCLLFTTVVWSCRCSAACLDWLRRDDPEECNSYLTVLQSWQNSTTAKWPDITSLGPGQMARGGGVISSLKPTLLLQTRLSANGEAGLRLSLQHPPSQSALLSCPGHRALGCSPGGAKPGGSCLLS